MAFDTSKIKDIGLSTGQRFMYPIITENKITKLQIFISVADASLAERTKLSIIFILFFIGLLLCLKKIFNI